MQKNSSAKEIVINEKAGGGDKAGSRFNPSTLSMESVWRGNDAMVINKRWYKPRIQFSVTEIPSMGAMAASGCVCVLERGISRNLIHTR